jgi:hypothetical protein
MERDKKRGNISEFERKKVKRVERDTKRVNLSELERKKE